LSFDYRSAEGKLERLSELAAECVKSNPDVIVAGFGTAPPRAAQAATTRIPIVFTSAGDPVGSGIVKSLSITCLNSQAAEINGKRLQVLENLVPGIREVAVLMQPDAPFTASALKDLQIAAHARPAIESLRGPGGQRTSIEHGGGQSRRDRLGDIGNGSAASPASADCRSRGRAAIGGNLHDPTLTNRRREIITAAARYAIPTIYPRREYVTAGGLVSYAPRAADSYRQAGNYAGRILKGEKPGDFTSCATDEI
jgi:putative ABC transport system substrate-binding protein